MSYVWFLGQPGNVLIINKEFLNISGLKFGIMEISL
jgi:hypothetical protein